MISCRGLGRSREKVVSTGRGPLYHLCYRLKNSQMQSHRLQQSAGQWQGLGPFEMCSVCTCEHKASSLGHVGGLKFNRGKVESLSLVSENPSSQVQVAEPCAQGQSLCKRLEVCLDCNFQCESLGAAASKPNLIWGCVYRSLVSARSF